MSDWLRSKAGQMPPWFLMLLVAGFLTVCMGMHVWTGSLDSQLKGIATLVDCMLVMFFVSMTAGCLSWLFGR